MPLMPCAFKLDCGSPLLTNYSSEGAEPFPPFYSVVYPDPRNPIDQDWSNEGCLYICISYVSQEEADLCAQRQAILCTQPPGEEIWYSAPATCCVPCPDGTEYCYSVAAGMFIAKTYAEAQELAQNYACQQAHDNRICLGSLPRCACLGGDYSATLTLEVPRSDLVWSLIGSLPPGLSFVTGGGVAVVTGTPTVNGTYAFQVVATAPDGSYAYKTYTIQVVEITTTALPDFVIGTPYSFQLTAAGGSGNYTWSVATGTLPDGLDLSLTGLISGTPTASALGDTLIFEVRDVTCETAQRVVLTPRVALSAISSARVLAYRGFKEYGAADATSQLYKRVDYAGSLTQVAFPNFNADVAVNNTQCGGFQYLYSGYDQIDNLGNVLSRHRKDMMLMCAASQPTLWETEISGPGTASVTQIFNPPALYGYCWPDDPESCSVCNTSDATWVSFKDDAWFGSIDYPTDMVWDVANLSTTPTVLTYAGNAALSGGVTLDPSIQGFPTNNGGLYTNDFPFVRLTSSGGFSATLSEPYTDADANATAVTYIGTSKTAENAPNYQITGSNNFITRRSRITAVTFEITCSRLIVGTDYTVTYELFTNTGVETEITVDFTATDTTHVISDTIPQPAANAKTTVRNPRIRYA